MDVAHYATKSVAYFYVNADAATALAASSGAPQANRNDFYFFRNAGGVLHQSELRLQSTNDCGTAERRGWLRKKYASCCAVAERCVTE